MNRPTSASPSWSVHWPDQYAYAQMEIQEKPYGTDGSSFIQVCFTGQSHSWKAEDDKAQHVCLKAITVQNSRKSRVDSSGGRVQTDKCFSFCRRNLGGHEISAAVKAVTDAIERNGELLKIVVVISICGIECVFFSSYKEVYLPKVFFRNIWYTLSIYRIICKNPLRIALSCRDLNNLEIYALSAHKQYFTL